MDTYETPNAARFYAEQSSDRLAARRPGRAGMMISLAFLAFMYRRQYTLAIEHGYTRREAHRFARHDFIVGFVAFVVIIALIVGYLRWA